MKETVLDAFKQARKAISVVKLKNASTVKQALAALAPVMGTIEEVLGEAFPALLEEILAAGGAFAIEALDAKGIRASAPAPVAIKFEFDVTNPKAKAWIEEHSTELIKDISETTRESLKDIITSAFEDGRTVDDIAEDIFDLVENEARAERIARTETMYASNEGQSLLWDQAVEEGLLTGKERQVWITTPDDRLCPICEPMEGVEIALDGEFDVDGEGIDGPPAHPNCRCTVGLVV